VCVCRITPSHGVKKLAAVLSVVGQPNPAVLVDVSHFYNSVKGAWLRNSGAPRCNDPGKVSRRCEAAVWGNAGRANTGGPPDNPRESLAAQALLPFINTIPRTGLLNVTVADWVVPLEALKATKWLLTSVPAAIRLSAICPQY